MTPATQTRELEYSSFRLSQTGLEPIGDPTLEQWIECGAFINKSERAVHFWIGDWLNYGEKAWGDRYAEALEKTRYEYKTLRNDKWVASRVPSERRRPELSFDHHAAVAEFSAEEQEDLLADAVAYGVNNERFRKYVKERDISLIDKSVSRAQDKPSPIELLLDAALDLQKQLNALDRDQLTPDQVAVIAGQLSLLKQQIDKFFDEVGHEEARHN